MLLDISKAIKLISLRSLLTSESVDISFSDYCDSVEFGILANLKFSLSRSRG